MKTLFLAAAIIIGAFASVLAWAVLTDNPLGGEPYAVIAIESVDRPESEQAPQEGLAAAEAPAPPKRAAMVADASASQTGMRAGMPGVTVSQPPPGFSVVGLAPREEASRAAQAPQAAPAARPALVAGIPDAAEPRQLGPVPVEALVQESRYGPLPRVAADGRRPSEVYARPTRYATRPRLGEPARIAIVINGLGLSETATGNGITKLPGQVTLAFSPYGRNLQGWVRQAREAGHEVMLQIPLEPFDYPDNDPGPHTLLTNLPADENLKRLQWLMARFTGYVGITNNMGAKFAASQESFLPVLEEFKARGLIYLDDGTAVRSTAGQIARDMGVAYSVAHLAIDAAQSPEEIDRALAKLEKMAREGGLAIGVGTSLPVTIERVGKWAESLPAKGIVLIPVSAAVRVQHQS